jgi:hypothetical protein
MNTPVQQARESLHSANHRLLRTHAALRSLGIALSHDASPINADEAALAVDLVMSEVAGISGLLDRLWLELGAIDGGDDEKTSADQ